MKLQGKVALISGGTSGMGAEIARKFAQEGAKVMICGRNTQRGQAVVADIVQAGGEARFQETDLTDCNQVAQLVENTASEFGALNILVPNAGVLGIGSITEVSIETWHETMNINLNSVFYLCRFSMPFLLKKGGSIVINASISGLKGYPNHPAYCASKGALIALVRNLAIDYTPRGVRANCICPGPVDTPLLHDSAKAFPNPDTVCEMVGKNTLVGRLGTVADIASAALFLASDDSSWITGSSLVIDGGVMTGFQW